MTPSHAYVFGPYRLMPGTRVLLYGDAPVHLGGRAFDLLVSLVERRDRTVGKEELMDLVWPKLVVEENNLQVQVVALRKVLGHPAIATVPGRGYRFTLPTTQEGAHSPVPAPAAGVPAAPRTPATNLPAGLPVLFGRDDDVRALVELMDRHALVTVAGMAGIGKTRLAQVAAATRVASTADGVWWIDLAPLADASLVPTAAAIALGLGLDGSTDAPTTLLAALRERAPLLVLDNAEHLLDGVARFVNSVRQAAPRVRLLITSQEALHVDGEQVFRPEPLALPEGDDPERIDACGAIALFVARARAADRRFGLHDANRGAVAEICRRLDGIPLAIELAAARVPLLGVEGLRDKLDQRFHVLTAGHRTSLRRHQTLRSALEWSFHLLSPDEQVVLRRLGVFVGGFTLEAVQQVAMDEAIDAWDVLEHVGALVDKSLVVADGEVVPRYRMLETTRLFALERLIDGGEADAVRRRHCDHFLAVAEECQRHLLCGDPRRHLAQLDRERDNLILALAWSAGPGDARTGLRLAAAMHHYWHMRALPALGADVTRAVLSRPGAQARTLERCLALVTAGWLCMWAGRDAESEADLQQALNLARELGDARALCHALAKFAHLKYHRNEPAEAKQLASEALAVGRSLGDSIELSDALVLRAHVYARLGEGEAARSLFEEALALRRRMDNRVDMMSAHMCLAHLEVNQGVADKARPHLDGALALLPMLDSNTAGLHLLALTVDWAAAKGEDDMAVLLEAARLRQLELSGLHNWQVDPDEPGSLEHARLVLSESARRRLEAAGRALSQETALQVMHRFLTAGRAHALALLDEAAT